MYDLAYSSSCDDAVCERFCGRSNRANLKCRLSYHRHKHVTHMPDIPVCVLQLFSLLHPLGAERSQSPEWVNEAAASLTMLVSDEAWESRCVSWVFATGPSHVFWMSCCSVAMANHRSSSIFCGRNCLVFKYFDTVKVTIIISLYASATPIDMRRRHYFSDRDPDPGTLNLDCDRTATEIQSIVL